MASRPRPDAPEETINRILERLDRLENAAPLASTSVHNGQTRFVGDEALKVEGSALVTGLLVVDGTGRVVGTLELQGDQVVQAGGQITVDGPVPIRLKQTNQWGSNQAAIMVGDDNGLYGFEGEGGQTALALVSGSTMLALTAEGIELSLLPAASGSGLRYLVVDPAGRLMRAPSGGPYDPENPDPDDPPGDNPEGYIWPANPATYGISDDFGEHVARGSAEPGVDVMTPVGAAVYAPGPGSVVDVHSSSSGATGRYVTIVTSGGDWFRFLHLSQTLVNIGDTVTQGQLVARSGASGFGSDYGYSPHLHITFKQGYTGTGLSLPTNDFQAYMAAA
jgi:hypothetical protein